MRVTLTAEELGLLVDALDSHEYWQLSDDQHRNDGFSQVEDGTDEAIDRCRALYARLERLWKRHHVVPKTVSDLVPNPKEDSHV